MPPLTNRQRDSVLPLLEKLRADIRDLAGGDETIVFQIRRYIAKRLEFDERGTPMQRRKLKDQMWKKQRGLCVECGEELPIRGAELDRVQAHKCHRASQEAKNFA